MSASHPMRGGKMRTLPCPRENSKKGSVFVLSVLVLLLTPQFSIAFGQDEPKVVTVTIKGPAVEDEGTGILAQYFNVPTSLMSRPRSQVTLVQSNAGESARRWYGTVMKAVRPLFPRFPQERGRQNTNKMPSAQCIPTRTLKTCIM